MEAPCEQLSETRAPTRHCGHVSQFPCSCPADSIKDSNYNVHERMLVCTYVRGCMWFKSFCFAMCRPSNSYAHPCPHRCTFLSCSCPAKEDSNSDVHACVHASCACMCMCVATNILRVMLRYAAHAAQLRVPFSQPVLEVWMNTDARVQLRALRLGRYTLASKMYAYMRVCMCTHT